ncbi:MAG: hypothetical protein AABY22_33710 [Nanoarchaeota archaeon]
MKFIKFRRMIKDENGIWRAKLKPDYYLSANIIDANGNVHKIENYIGVIKMEFAFNENDLIQKLNGDMAEIEMPAKSWYIRLWRKIFPLQIIEVKG